MHRSLVYSQARVQACHARCKHNQDTCIHVAKNSAIRLLFNHVCSLEHKLKPQVNCMSACVTTVHSHESNTEGVYVISACSVKQAKQEPVNTNAHKHWQAVTDMQHQPTGGVDHSQLTTFGATCRQGEAGSASVGPAQYAPKLVFCHRLAETPDEGPVLTTLSNRKHTAGALFAGSAKQAAQGPAPSRYAAAAGYCLAISILLMLHLQAVRSRQCKRQPSASTQQQRGPVLDSRNHLQSGQCGSGLSAAAVGLHHL